MAVVTPPAEGLPADPNPPFPQRMRKWLLAAGVVVVHFLGDFQAVDWLPWVSLADIETALVGALAVQILYRCGLALSFRASLWWHAKMARMKQRVLALLRRLIREVQQEPGVNGGEGEARGHEDRGTER
ncbi:hypothetical protein [Streptomyces luteogriseus]|uniref:hypothetical protein n=1 Tax=Streptomyces luteogriseus TaxID=68233 RepID=UPI003829284C